MRAHSIPAHNYACENYWKLFCDYVKGICVIFVTHVKYFQKYGNT